MTDGITGEPRLTLTQAARQLGLHVATIHRWRLRGVRGVRLETYCLGGLRFTTLPALERFAERCTAAADGTAVPTRTSRQRELAIAAAERELAAS